MYGIRCGRISAGRLQDRPSGPADRQEAPSSQSEPGVSAIYDLFGNRKTSIA